MVTTGDFNDNGKRRRDLTESRKGKEKEDPQGEREEKRPRFSTRGQEPVFDLPEVPSVTGGSPFPFEAFAPADCGVYPGPGRTQGQWVTDQQAEMMTLNYYFSNFSD